jgi:hypothetical protein
MTSYVDRWESVSLAGLVVILGGLALYARRRRATRGPELVLAVIGTHCHLGDALRHHPFVFGALLWGLLSSIGEVFVAMPSSPHYFTTTHGILSVLTYGGFVALEVGAYYQFWIAGKELTSTHSLASLGLVSSRGAANLEIVPSDEDAATVDRMRELAPLWLYHASLIVGATLVQWRTIASELDYGMASSPWVSHVRTGSLTLNASGAAHFLVRGIGAYFLLGFLASIVFVLIRVVCAQPKAPSNLFTSAYEPKPIVKHVGLAVITYLLIGTATTAMAGLVLLFEAAPNVTLSIPSLRHVVGSPNWSLLWEATWLIWVAVTCVWTGLSIALILGLHKFLLAGRQSISERAYQDLSTASAAVTIKEHSDYWDARAKIFGVMDKIDTWPVVGVKALSLAVLLQIVALLLQLALRKK